MMDASINLTDLRDLVTGRANTDIVAARAAEREESAYLEAAKNALRTLPFAPGKRTAAGFRQAEADLLNKRGAPRFRAKVANNTYLRRMDENCIGYQFRGTYVGKVWRDGTFQVNVDRWGFSPTTRDRVDRFLARYTPQDARDYVWDCRGEDRHQTYTSPRYYCARLKRGGTLHLCRFNPDLEWTRRHLVTTYRFLDGTTATSGYETKCADNIPPDVREYAETPWGDRRAKYGADYSETRNELDQQVRKYTLYAYKVEAHYEKETGRGDSESVGNLSAGAVTVHATKRAQVARARATRRQARAEAGVRDARRELQRVTNLHEMQRVRARTFTDDARETFYKVVRSTGEASYAHGFHWPVNETLTCEGSLAPCHNGFHYTDAQYLHGWIHRDSVVRYAYPSGEMISAGSKYVARSLRLGAVVPENVLATLIRTGSLSLPDELTPTLEV